MIPLDDIFAARARIADAVYLSPLARSESLSRQADAPVYLKLENLQMTGSLKERGALNRLLALSHAERALGVVASSAGNHAQAVAYISRRLKIEAIIVMPETAPLTKVGNTRGYGPKWFCTARPTPMPTKRPVVFNRLGTSFSSTRTMMPC